MGLVKTRRLAAMQKQQKAKLGIKPLSGKMPRKRRSDGGPFYGCKSYPKCRGMVDVE